MTPSLGAVLVAVGCTLAAGALGLLLIQRLRGSVVWAIRLAAVVPAATIGAGVAAASATMLLEPQQVRIMALVLAVAFPVSVALGVVASRRVADLQRRAAEQASVLERDRAIEERRRELIAWLSHDLRTPLARLKALAEAHEDGLAEPDHADRMIREVDALAAIVADIATLARLTDARQPMQADQVDYSDVVSDVVAANQPLAAGRGIALRGSTSGAVMVLGDPAQLSRAVENLIVNALRHTDAGGEVQVTVGTEHGWSRVTVADECGGISDEDLQRLFEPGWRGTVARTPGDAGAGLGLAIAQRIVTSHGGTLDVTNGDSGCAFTIALPTAASQPQAASSGVVTTGR